MNKGSLPSVGLGWQIGLTSGWGIHGAYLMRRLMQRGLVHVISTERPDDSIRAFPCPGILEINNRGPFPMVWAGNNKPSIMERPWPGDWLIQVMEQFAFSEQDLERLRQFDDRIITVSEWNARALNGLGIKAKCVHLGVDTEMFKPTEERRPITGRWGRDTFVVFSGGKAEYRKGQDIVIAAFRDFNERYPNSVLVTNWYNHWAHTAMEGFSHSEYVSGPPSSRDGSLDIHSWVRRNGIPDYAHMDIGLVGRQRLVEVLQGVDVAVFPNRCEGGTNMAAMECLSAGVYTLLSAGHGHADLLKAHMGDRIEASGELVGGWAESDKKHLVRSLELAYENPEETQRRGHTFAGLIRTGGWDWDTRMDAQITAMGLDTLNTQQRYFRPVDAEQELKYGRQLADHFEKLRGLGYVTGAHAVIKRAAEIAPSDPIVIGNLAASYTLNHEYSKAKRTAMAAGALTGDRVLQAKIAHNLALAEWFGGDLEKAEPMLATLALGSTEARWNYANLLLLKGKWLKGFKEMEIRKVRLSTHYPKRATPLWLNPEEDLTGKTVWVTCEQGIGDVFQFARYLPWVRSRCARVVFTVWDSIAPLFYGYPGVDEVRVEAINVPEPAADFTVSLMSLPMMHGTLPTSCIDDPGYFRVCAYEQITSLSVARPSLKVGLVWAGSKDHPRDRDRTIPLEQLLPLTESPNNTVYSLQVGERAKDIETLGVGSIINDLAPQLKNWHDTMGALVNLDVLVTVDTSIAHMAGALGVTTYLLLSKIPDWRWGMGSMATPWYNSVALFRQTKAGSWDEPIGRVTKAVRRLWDDQK